MGFTSIKTYTFKQEDTNQRVVIIRITPSADEKTEDEVNAAFEAATPRIWSTLLALDVAVLKLMPEMTADRSIHRCGEFVKITKAIQQIVNPDVSLAAVMAENRLQERSEALEDDPFIGLLQKFIAIEYPEGWDKPVKDLWAELNAFDSAQGKRFDVRVVPKETPDLRAKLRSIRGALPSVGLDIEFPTRKDEGARTKDGLKIYITPNKYLPKFKVNRHRPSVDDVIALYEDLEDEENVEKPTSLEVVVPFQRQARDMVPYLFNTLPVSGTASPSVRVLRFCLFVYGLPIGKYGDISPIMTLSWCHMLNATVAVFVVVPVDERRHPLTCCC